MILNNWCHDWVFASFDIHVELFPCFEGYLEESSVLDILKADGELLTDWFILRAVVSAEDKGLIIALHRDEVTERTFRHYKEIRSQTSPNTNLAYEESLPPVCKSSPASGGSESSSLLYV